MNAMTSTWKVPPKEKVYEAISAVLDGRIDIRPNNTAYVSSSDQSKKYTVTWTDNQQAFSSNDNASYFQGYIGYPIIALLLHFAKLQFTKENFEWLAGVAWKQINKAHKNNYAKAVEAVMTERVPDEEQRAAIVREVDTIYESLLSLEVGRLKPVTRPPQ